ncbi:hypothetical protein ACTA71_008209 [Dictyostelium dimigraforme]
MKILLTLILTITLFSNFNVNATITWNCIKSGGKCFIEGSDKCPNGEYCAPNKERLTDSNGEELPGGICSPLIKEGEKCYLYQRCDYGLVCQVPYTEFPGDRFKVEGVCVSSPYLSVGETCSNDTQCFSSLECKQKKCTPRSLEYDKECFSDYDCFSQNYCDSGYCKPHNKINGNCLRDNQCSYGLICRNEKCIEMFSLKNGKVCENEEDCQSYICDYNLLENGQRNISWYSDRYCQKREINSNDCKKDGCNNPNEVCDSRSNKCFDFLQIGSEKCKSATKLKDDCYIKNNCAVRTDLYTEQRHPKSCNMKHCQLEINNYLQQCTWEANFC